MATRHNKEVAKARALNTSKVCLGFDIPRAFELGGTWATEIVRWFG